VSRSLKYYRDRLKSKNRRLNKVQPLQDYFYSMISGESVAKADLGSGPFTLVGTESDIDVTVIPSDILANEYNEMIREASMFPVVHVEYQNMESLTYEDESFDIVHCVNALDHTKGARKALKEMYRICKHGGWIYLRHYPNTGERRRYRGHYWNVTENGIIWNRETTISLPKFKTVVEGRMIVSKRRK